MFSKRKISKIGQSLKPKHRDTEPAIDSDDNLNDGGTRKRIEENLDDPVPLFDFHPRDSKDRPSVNPRRETEHPNAAQFEELLASLPTDVRRTVQSQSTTYMVYGACQVHVRTPSGHTANTPVLFDIVKADDQKIDGPAAQAVTQERTGSFEETSTAFFGVVEFSDVPKRDKSVMNITLRSQDDDLLYADHENLPKGDDAAAGTHDVRDDPAADGATGAQRSWVPTFLNKAKHAEKEKRDVINETWKSRKKREGRIRSDHALEFEAKLPSIYDSALPSEVFFFDVPHARNWEIVIKIREKTLGVMHGEKSVVVPFPTNGVVPLSKGSVTIRSGWVISTPSRRTCLGLLGLQGLRYPCHLFKQGEKSTKRIKGSIVIQLRDEACDNRVCVVNDANELLDTIYLKSIEHIATINERPEADEWLCRISFVKGDRGDRTFGMKLIFESKLIRLSFIERLLLDMGLNKQKFEGDFDHEELSIFVGTWNAGNAKPNKSILHDWITPNHHIYCITSQECVWKKSAANDPDEGSHHATTSRPPAPRMGCSNYDNHTEGKFCASCKRVITEEDKFDRSATVHTGVSHLPDFPTLVDFGATETGAGAADLRTSTGHTAKTGGADVVRFEDLHNTPSDDLQEAVFGGAHYDDLEGCCTTVTNANTAGGQTHHTKAEGKDAKKAFDSLDKVTSFAQAVSSSSSGHIFNRMVGTRLGAEYITVASIVSLDRVMCLLVHWTLLRCVLAADSSHFLLTKLGNKGSVGCHLELQQGPDRPPIKFNFCGAHLAAGSDLDSYKHRNANYAQVCHEHKMNQEFGVEWPEAADVSIFCGDFNYRVLDNEMKRKDKSQKPNKTAARSQTGGSLELARNHMHQVILERDELSIARREGLAFSSAIWKEGKFEELYPSYKLCTDHSEAPGEKKTKTPPKVLNSGKSFSTPVYASEYAQSHESSSMNSATGSSSWGDCNLRYSQNRDPAWTDRIFWTTPTKVVELVQEKLAITHNHGSSDHAPLASVFSLKELPVARVAWKTFMIKHIKVMHSGKRQAMHLRTVFYADYLNQDQNREENRTTLVKGKLCSERVGTYTYEWSSKKDVLGQFHIQSPLSTEKFYATPIRCALLCSEKRPRGHAILFFTKCTHPDTNMIMKSDVHKEMTLSAVNSIIQDGLPIGEIAVTAAAII